MHLSRFLGALSLLEETVKETDGDRSVRSAVLGVVGTEGGAKHGKQESASLRSVSSSGVAQASAPGQSLNFPRMQSTWAVPTVITSHDPLTRPGLDLA